MRNGERTWTGSLVAWGCVSVWLLGVAGLTGCGGNEAAEVADSKAVAAADTSVAETAERDPWLKAAELNAAEVQQSGLSAGEDGAPRRLSLPRH